MSTPTPQLLAEITCPNCWHPFKPEDALFVARHDTLIGDPVAGPGTYRRFLPSRFNIIGDALDARGMACSQLACPSCHLELARTMLEFPPAFFSIVGVPASGKSYFLATLAWQLRKLGPQLGFNLSDADPRANHALHEYEEMLFLSHQPEVPVALRKTEIQGTELYQTVMMEGQRMSFPRPFQFALSASEHFPKDRPFPHRAVVLYDNAGEHFLPGSDAGGSPVTMHLAKSSAIFFVFDPTQDPRFRQLHNLPQEARAEGAIRQEIILNEMAARVRRFRGLGQNAKHDRPLVMILAKSDTWLRDAGFSGEPIVPVSSGRAQVDIKEVERLSALCRAELEKACPQVVSAVEGFSSKVLFIPVSSLGQSAEKFEKDGVPWYGIRPKDVKPCWVTAPLLWALSKNTPGLLEAC